MASRALPIALLAQAVPMLTRHELAALTEQLIDVLDSIDGDADLEDDDDDSAVDDRPCDGVNEDREPDEYGDQFADPIAKAEQRERIRRQRCIPVWSSYRGQRERIGHELFYEPTVPTKRQLFRRKRGVPRYPRA